MLLYVHKNRRLISDAGAQDDHLDFHALCSITALTFIYICEQVLFGYVLH